jgi:hypothetical protein
MEKYRLLNSGNNKLVQQQKDLEVLSDLSPLLHL